MIVAVDMGVEREFEPVVEVEADEDTIVEALVAAAVVVKVVDGADEIEAEAEKTEEAAAAEEEEAVAAEEEDDNDEEDAGCCSLSSERLRSHIARLA